MRSSFRFLACGLLASVIAGCSGEEYNNSPPVTNLPPAPIAPTGKAVNKPPLAPKGRGVAIPGAGGANVAPGS